MWDSKSCLEVPTIPIAHFKYYSQCDMQNTPGSRREAEVNSMSKHYSVSDTIENGIVTNGGIKVLEKYQTMQQSVEKIDGYPKIVQKAKTTLRN